MRKNSDLGLIEGQTVGEWAETRPITKC
jgi:hypothetical protein